jgi:hypothetical protein
MYGGMFGQHEFSDGIEIRAAYCFSSSVGVMLSCYTPKSHVLCGAQEEPPYLALTYAQRMGSAALEISVLNFIIVTLAVYVLQT